MPDVAIVVGHHPTAKGAALSVGERQIAEYDFWLPFAYALRRCLYFSDIGYAVIQRPNPKPDDELMGIVNDTGARCAIELHFNGFTDPRAQGSEMLHWHTSEQGRLLADLLDRKSTRLNSSHSV